jgi:DNA-binding PadR family transcriptional regulator
MLKTFYTGFIRIHILHHAAKAPLYGLWMIEELREHGYALSPGTLYPILRDLESKGLLGSHSETVKGKVRKYYTITLEGLKTLEDSKKKMRELVVEVLGQKLK